MNKILLWGGERACGQKESMVGVQALGFFPLRDIRKQLWRGKNADNIAGGILRQFITTDLYATKRNSGDEGFVERGVRYDTTSGNQKGKKLEIGERLILASESTWANKSYLGDVTHLCI